ncbi:hypothetical protein Pla108_26240 [Botrimarina colliarenosi]|uniref:HRDC domain protein n=1 Tax=Botrimarina colliarenosi TaxID=2528001 RepID=A0A5C6AB91_9BACT|nr:hypothetical protein [Botrimarina colliarenosi]TWT96849.1 hypothetical protein Pla108_26240 [Botrimarina colliarenosi]
MARKASQGLPFDPPSSPQRRSALNTDRYRLEGTYERLRRALVAGPQDGRIDQPLSYWVLPSDRRLPIVFLDRTLRDLLAQPLEDLMQTPGVGQKKILGFFDLLRRAIKSESADRPFGMAAEPAIDEPSHRRGVGVEPASVSEAVWREWCETILRAGFGDHALGRVAPSLRKLPTVIWETPLSDYAGRSLADIRLLKTHGEKRVNAILEVFGAIYEAVSTAALNEDLQLDVTARFVPELTRWLVAHAARPDKLTLADIQERVAKPLVRQIEIDLGEPVTGLASERLGFDGATPTVKTQAEQLGVTRARVYQLLEDCGRVLAVRWPEGRWLLAPLADRPAKTDPEAMGLIHAIRVLFYPE